MVAEKSRCIVGIATLTMLMSSTDMNMPVMSTARGTPQPPPVAGFAGAGAATGAGAAVAASVPTSTAMIPVSHGRGIRPVDPHIPGGAPT